MFNAIEFIEKKRDGGRHTDFELRSLVDEVMEKSLPDYQLSSWLMAAFLNGLDDEEIMSFTRALAESGDMVSYPDDTEIIDKHSTGGVGDKVTLILVPLVASCGGHISKLSGPGLGYTGGTVDKLSAIPGLQTHLTLGAFKAQVQKIGCAISGHSLELAPAEGRFYKLRDVTGTVPSIPLITSSIISKKLAGGANGFLFDVKCGSGAFMHTEKEARALAEKLVSVSKQLGKKSMAVLSDMEQPLGRWVGNAAEVYEAIEVLSGSGPNDTRELCVTLGAYMLALSGGVSSEKEGMSKCAKALDDGSALKKFAELIKEQGGNAAVTDDPEKFLPSARKCFSICSDRDGYVSRLDALSIGEALRALGGGRMKQEDLIDLAVSIELKAKIGNHVNAGDTLIDVHYNEEAQLNAAEQYINGCWKISDSCAERKLIIDRIY